MSRSPTDQRPHEFLACSDVCRQQWYECSWSAQPEEGIVSGNRVGADRTHIEDDEGLFELGLPGGNGLLVVPRVENPRGCIATALLDDLASYFRDGSVIE